ncbi:MAG: GH25 family lysozyme [Bacillota bacterium]|nr:GH25 family lysozyme [Bacillota bacterium]
MNNRVLKILISMVLTACLIATPVFGLQSVNGDEGNGDELLQMDEEMQNQDMTDEEGAAELNGLSEGELIEEPEIFESEPEDTPQDVEVKADSWRYEDGDVLPKYETLAETQVELPEAAELNSSTYGETKDKSWKVGKTEYSGGYLKGIDVSVWQGRDSELRSKIDWSKVKQDVIDNGVYDFVIIRCGYGINTTSRDDSEFTYNVEQCEKYGIPYGVYLYSYATKDSQARSEADHAMRLLKGHYPDYPVYYDLEDSSITKATKYSKSKITNFAKIFCSTLDNNGYRTGVYANLNWYSKYIDKIKLSGYSLWVAQWPGKTQEYSNGSDYSIWQCSSSGSVSGIYGRVDINLLVKPYSEIEKYMSYESLPSTLAVSDVDYDAYLNADVGTVRKGPGEGYKPLSGVSLSKRQKVSVTRTANGYSEVTDESGNTGWIASGKLVFPDTPWGFEEITEGDGDDAVTKTILISYAGDILKDTTANIGGYIYGTDADGVKLVSCTEWSGYKCYTYDDQGRAYINKSKTKRKATVYANPGSAKKGTLKKGKSFYVLRTSGKWSQMSNGLWIKTSYTKKTAVYPTVKPSTENRYTTKIKKKTRSYSGPSTSYIKKKILKKNKTVTVVGTNGSWAKLTTGSWVPLSKLK